MWSIALIITVAGVTSVFPGIVYLKNEADCHKFGEIWERTYAEKVGGNPTVDHLCVEIQPEGVDI